MSADTAIRTSLMSGPSPMSPQEFDALRARCFHERKLYVFFEHELAAEDSILCGWMRKLAARMFGRRMRK